MLKNQLRNFQLLSNCVYDFNPVYQRYGVSVRLLMYWQHFFRSKDKTKRSIGKGKTKGLKKIFTDRFFLNNLYKIKNWYD